MSKQLEKVRIGASALTDNVYVGTLDGTRQGWSSKVDRTSDFIAALLEWCPPDHERVITASDGRNFRVVVTLEDGETSE